MFGLDLAITSFVTAILSFVQAILNIVLSPLSWFFDINIDIT